MGIINVKEMENEWNDLNEHDIEDNAYIHIVHIIKLSTSPFFLTSRVWLSRINNLFSVLLSVHHTS